MKPDVSAIAPYLLIGFAMLLWWLFLVIQWVSKAYQDSEIVKMLEAEKFTKPCPYCRMTVRTAGIMLTKGGKFRFRSIGNPRENSVIAMRCNSCGAVSLWSEIPPSEKVQSQITEETLRFK